MSKRISMIRLGVSFFIGIADCLLSSCNDGRGIQQAYSFMVETMPVQTKIVKGEAAKFAVSLNARGAVTGRGTRFATFCPMAKGRSAWTKMKIQCFCPMIAIRSNAKSFVFTIPPLRPTRKPLISTSRTLLSRSYNFNNENEGKE